MEPSQSRSVLAGPLQFGNIEQIEAIRVLYPPLIDVEGNRRYRVDISVDYTETVYVYATTEEEAKSEARAGFDSSDLDFDLYVKEAEGEGHDQP